MPSSANLRGFAKLVDRSDTFNAQMVNKQPASPMLWMLFMYTISIIFHVVCIHVICFRTFGMLQQLSNLDVYASQFSVSQVLARQVLFRSEAGCAQHRYVIQLY